MSRVCKMLNQLFGMYYCVIFMDGLCQRVISRFRLPDGSLMEITKVYPLDAVFDNPEDVPEDVSRHTQFAWNIMQIMKYMLTF